jgi:hypothetical protein
MGTVIDSGTKFITLRRRLPLVVSNRQPVFPSLRVFITQLRPGSILVATEGERLVFLPVPDE